MTADEWEPSEEFEKALSESGWIVDLRILKAVRPLIIAEARPQIEAEERERMFAIIEAFGGGKVAADLRALKDNKP